MSSRRDASDQPVTTAQTRSLGVTRHQLESTIWRGVFRGVHVSSTASFDLLTRCRAALLLHPADAHLSHATAAELMGVPLTPEDEVHVTVHRRRHRHYRPGVRPHLRVSPSECHEVRGLPVSSPLQMFVEIAASRSLVDAVITGDHLVRRGWVTLAQLVTHCHKLSGKHQRKARRAAHLVRVGVDSPMETRLRLLLVFSGLPEPTINLRVRDADGVVVRRFELAYPEHRLIIEYDGRHHVERREQWEADLDRREEIEDNDWRILVVISRGIYVEPERTLHRVRDALRRRGAPLPAIKDDWRAHFPGR